MRWHKIRPKTSKHQVLVKNELEKNASALKYLHMDAVEKKKKHIMEANVQ